MSDEDEKKETKKEHWLTKFIVKHPWRTFAICGILVCVAWGLLPLLLTLARDWGWGPDTLNLEVLGQFGDMFGVMSSMVAALALVALVISVFLQRAELKTARDEM